MSQSLTFCFEHILLEVKNNCPQDENTFKMLHQIASLNKNMYKNVENIALFHIQNIMQNLSLFKYKICKQQLDSEKTYLHILKSLMLPKHTCNHCELPIFDTNNAYVQTCEACFEPMICNHCIREHEIDVWYHNETIFTCEHCTATVCHRCKNEYETYLQNQFSHEHKDYSTHCHHCNCKKSEGQILR